MTRVLWLPLAAMMLGGCGYHVAGHADLMPKTVKTIAVPAFGNITTRYQLARLLPADITHEFISRTRYRIVADPSQADAVLNGTLTNFLSIPAIVDPSTGRATGVEIIVQMQLTLTDRATGKVLFQRPSYEQRQRYEIAVDPQIYFDETGTAMQRVSKEAARGIVTAILENF